MKFAVKMLLFSAAAVSATRIKQKEALGACPCECISHEPLWAWYDYANEIYYDPGCTDCKVVMNEACFTIHKAEEDKKAAALLAADQKAAADAEAASEKHAAVVSIEAAAKLAAEEKAAADAAEAALKA